jgi:dihydrofolate reductase
MSIKAILAHDSDWGIGKDGDLPWPKNKKDLEWFKECTSGCAVVMGRKTWDSLPFKPLPKRKNVVISSNEVEGADLTLNEGYKECIIDLSHEHPIWIIGGAQIVEDCLDIIDELWLNDVVQRYDCDIFLPKEKIGDLFYADDIEIMPFGVVTKWKRK